MIYTDASKVRWGARLGYLKAQGLWSNDQRAWHINALEMEALQLGISEFQEALRGKRVVAMSDNTTIVEQVR